MPTGVVWILIVGAGVLGLVAGDRTADLVLFSVNVAIEELLRALNTFHAPRSCLQLIILAEDGQI